MIDGSFEPSYKKARAKASRDDFEVNSPNCASARIPGRQAEKTVTLTAAGDPVAVNLFVLSGLVRLNDIVGIFEDVTNVVDIEEVRLDVYDGTIATVITLADNLVCDGASLKSAVVKVDDATGKMVFMNSNQVRIEETTKQQNLDPILVNGKYGFTTYVRLLYKNIDTNLNCQIKWRAEWRSFCGGTGTLVAV